MSGQRALAKRWTLSLLMLSLLAIPGTARADFAVGLEVASQSRSAPGFADEGSTTAGFMGFDLGNSMFYMRLSETESEDEFGTPVFERSRFETSWHWNERTSKRNFISGIVGLELRDYTIGLESADFWGFHVGGSGTRFVIGETLYFSIRGRVGMLVGDEDELRPAPARQQDEPPTFLTFDAQAAFGFLVGGRQNFTLQAGVRVERTDFKDRFWDDEANSLFVAARFFAGSQ